MTAVLDHLVAARHTVADLVVGLDEAQRRAPTLCEKWTPVHVLAHLSSLVLVPFPKFMLAMAKNRGDFDVTALQVSQGLVDRMSAEELAAGLKEKATKTPPLPGFPTHMPLLDTLVHTQDIRRPLGLDGQLDDDAVVEALDFLTTHKQASNFTDTELLAQTRLEATDLDWAHGPEGAEMMRGKGEALLMALARRDVDDEIDGPAHRFR